MPGDVMQMADPGPEGSFWPSQEILERGSEDGDRQRKVGPMQRSGLGLELGMPGGTGTMAGTCRLWSKPASQAHSQGWTAERS